MPLYRHLQLGIMAVQALTAAQTCLRVRYAGLVRPLLSPRPPCRPIDVRALYIRLFYSHYHRPLHANPLAVVGFDMRIGQVRRQSATPNNEAAPQRRPPPPPRGRLLFLRLLMRAVFTPFRGQSLRNLYEKNPEETVLALAV